MKIIHVFLIASLLLFFSCAESDQSTKQFSHSRHIELEGEPNFRDLGGYKTADGKTVKWGQIYRSGKLSNLT